MFIVISALGLLSLSTNRHWFFRVPGYLAIFSCFLGLLMLLIEIYLGPARSALSVFTCILIVGTIVFHLSRILPFTRLGAQEVPGETIETSRLSIILCNVLQSNRKYHQLINQVQEHSPDLFAAFETDKKWGLALEKELNKIYPYRFTVYRDDTYGIAVFSKYHLTQKITRRIYNEKPALVFQIDHPVAKKVICYILHPIPPSPTEAETSIPKDKELDVIAKEISQIDSNHPVLVMGDINDVAWSQTTTRFVKTSGLYHPMKGRKLIITFPTYCPWLGFPLDQIFVSRHFAVHDMKRLPHVGSDHFPIYFSFAIGQTESKP